MTIMRLPLLSLLALPLGVALAQAESIVDRPDVHQALDYLKSHHEANVAEQIKISEIPASPFEEKERGKFLAAEFKRIGLADVETDGIGNVLGWYRGDSDRTIVMAAHLDTVFPPGTDFTVHKKGTRLNGTGIQDDSRGLAVILDLAAALELAKIKTHHTILFVANVGEEGIGNLRGTKYLFNEGKYKDKLDAFVSIDADGDRVIANREIGSRRYKVTITGPGGHSWANFGRPNPANALGRIVAKLADLDVPSNPDTDRTSYNVGRIGGGTSVNSIPFEVWFEFDMRSVSEAEVIKLEAKFLAIVKAGVAEENAFAAAHGKGIFAKGNLEVNAQMIGLRHAVAGPANAHLVEAAQRAIRDLGFGDPVLAPSSTDSNAVASLGKPAITLGGGGVAANAHSLQEWFDPTDAYKGTQAALVTLLNYDAAPNGQ